jgi:hypothetical protein
LPKKIIYYYLCRFSDEYDPEETLSASEDEYVVDLTKGKEDMDISNVEDRQGVQLVNKWAYSLTKGHQ